MISNVILVAVDAIYEYGVKHLPVYLMSHGNFGHDSVAYEVRPITPRK